MQEKQPKALKRRIELRTTYEKANILYKYYISSQ